MLSQLLSRWILGGAAIAAAAWLLGDHMSIGSAGDATSDQLITLAIVAAVFAVVNTFIGPVVKVLSLPFIILTLGLALLVINAGLLLLTARISEAFDAALFVDGFWWAVLASVVISVVHGILDGLFGE